MGRDTSRVLLRKERDPASHGSSPQPLNLINTALDELERQNLTTALITLCIGGGMGVATIIERL